MPYSQQIRRFGSFCILWLLQSSISSSLSISEEIQRIENDGRSPFSLHGNPDLLHGRGQSHHRHEGEYHAREYPVEFIAANGQSILDRYDGYDGPYSEGLTQNPFMPFYHHRRSGNHETNTHQKDFLRMKYFDDPAHENSKHRRHRHGEGHRFHEYPSEYIATLDQFNGNDMNLMYDQYPLSPFNQHRRSEDRELNDFPHHSSSHRIRHRHHLHNPFYEQSKMYANDDLEDEIRLREKVYCQQHPAKCSRAHGRRDQSYPGELDGRYPMNNQQSPEEPIYPIDPIQMQQFTAALASISFIDRPKNPQSKLSAKLNEPTQSVADRDQETSQASPTSSSESSKDKILTSPDGISERNEESKPSVTPAKSKDIKKTETSDHSKSDVPKVTDDKSELKKQPDSVTTNDFEHSIESKDQSQVTILSDSSKNEPDTKLENEPNSTPSSTLSGDKVESTEVDDQLKSEKTSTLPETDKQLVDPKSADSHTQDEKLDDELESIPASGFSDDQPKDIKSEA